MTRLLFNVFKAGIKGVVYGLMGAFAVFLAQIGSFPGPEDPIGKALWISLVVPVVVGIAKAIERLRSYDPKKDPAKP